MTFGMNVYYYVPVTHHVEIDDSLPKDHPDSGYRVCHGMFIKWRIRQDMYPIGDGGFLPMFIEEIIVYNFEEKKMDYVVPENFNAELTFAHYGLPK